MCWGVDCPKCNVWHHIKEGFNDGDTLNCSKCGVEFCVDIFVQATYAEEDEDE